jgi:serine/threonine protein kinase
MALAPGTKLGPYEVLAPLGAGGMGEVYRARDPRLGRDVAIKVIPVSFAADTERLRRFEQEARAVAALNHPNILAIYDIGTREGAPFIISELLEGESLRTRLSGGALPVRKAIEYAVQMGQGLAAAHEKGIVHRDLKPENIFVTRDGRVKILDFGLAKLTQPEGDRVDTISHQTEAGVVLGTVGYMSPEQVRGKPADHRSDLFSFGAILYEMLSGRRAFHGETAADTMSAILREESPELPETNRGIAPGLGQIVRHCLEKNPEERFQSAHDIAFDLQLLSGQTPSGAPEVVAASDGSGSHGRNISGGLFYRNAFDGSVAQIPAAHLPARIHPISGLRARWADRDLLCDVEREGDTGSVFHTHWRFAVPSAPVGRQPNRGHFLLRRDGHPGTLALHRRLDRPGDVGAHGDFRRRATRSLG